MTVDFFTKGKGFDYLRVAYGLYDHHINELRRTLYYETDTKVDEKWEIVCNWIPEEEGSDSKHIIMSSSAWPRWHIVDDAIERFLNLTGIKPDGQDLSDLHFRCIHVSPAIDGGESIRKNGLRKNYRFIGK